MDHFACTSALTGEPSPCTSQLRKKVVGQRHFRPGSQLEAPASGSRLCVFAEIFDTSRGSPPPVYWQKPEMNALSYSYSATGGTRIRNPGASEYEYEYHFIEYEYDLVAISEKCRIFTSFKRPTRWRVELVLSQSFAMWRCPSR